MVELIHLHNFWVIYLLNNNSLKIQFLKLILWVWIQEHNNKVPIILQTFVWLLIRLEMIFHSRKMKYSGIQVNKNKQANHIMKTGSNKIKVLILLTLVTIYSRSKKVLMTCLVANFKMILCFLVKLKLNQHLHKLLTQALQKSKITIKPT